MGLAIIGSSESGGHSANSNVSSQMPTQLGFIEGRGQQYSETFRDCGSWVDKRPVANLGLDSQQSVSLLRPSVTLPSLKGPSLQPATSLANFPFFEVKGEEDSWSCYSETLGWTKIVFSPCKAKKRHAELGPLNSVLLKFLPPKFEDYEQDWTSSIQKEVKCFEQERDLLQSLTWLKKSLDDDNFVFYIHHQIPPLKATLKELHQWLKYDAVAREKHERQYSMAPSDRDEEAKHRETEWIDWILELLAALQAGLPIYQSKQLRNNCLSFRKWEKMRSSHG